MVKPAASCELHEVLARLADYEKSKVLLADEGLFISENMEKGCLTIHASKQLEHRVFRCGQMIPYTDIFTMKLNPLLLALDFVIQTLDRKEREWQRLQEKSDTLAATGKTSVPSIQPTSIRSTST